MGIFTKGPPDYAKQAKKQEAARQALINTGTQNINQAFTGFDPEFYNQRSLAYQQYALPQLAHQYQGTKSALGFGLFNRGLQGSGTAQQQYSNLNRQMGMQKQGIMDAGRGQAQDLQNQVEAQRNALLAQLYQTANPELAGQNATLQAASMRVPSVYQPLGNMFQNLLNQYYQRQVLESYQPRSFVSPSGSGNYNNVGAIPDITYGGQ